MAELTTPLTIYGLLLVFVSVFLDEGGLPIPSFAALLLAGAVAHAQPLLLLLILAAVIAASLTADLLWYWMGRRFGPRIQALGCRISLSPDTSIRWGDKLYNRAGPAVLLVARYLPGLTNLIVTRAATARTHFLPFLLFNVAGIILYVGVPMVLGTVFHGVLGQVLNAVSTSGWSGAAVVFAALLLYAGGRWWERRISLREMDQILVEESRL